MALRVDHDLTPEKLVRTIEHLFELSGKKILSLEKSWNNSRGAPVFTVNGIYTTRGWTDWTEGFRHGSALLQFDATGETRFLELGVQGTMRAMPPHVSHIGVHDHGFNIVSTYGNLWRLIMEGRAATFSALRDNCELALKVSGAIQAARWSKRRNGGYIYSFNGPHSLFIDTMRSLRSLALAHMLGHELLAEQDERVSLLNRLIEHGMTTAEYNVYYGKGRDIYDVPGRVAHEAIFNMVNGEFRCPNSQQGYSPFSTWTRGLAWAVLGFAEELEFLRALRQQGDVVVNNEAEKRFLEAAQVTAEYYMSVCCTDGIPVWDTGAPNLHRLGDYANMVSDPFNPWEPVDSSAAAIAAQGLLRLGNYLSPLGQLSASNRYKKAALTIAKTLFSEPYLAEDEKHQGLILHSVYHRPNGWDHIPAGQRVPNGESSMWGDYHARELALMILREARSETYLTFFAGGPRIIARSAMER